MGSVGFIGEDLDWHLAYALSLEVCAANASQKILLAFALLAMGK